MYYKLKTDLQINKITSPINDKVLKIINPNNNEEYLLNNNEIQLLKALATLTPKEIAEKYKIQESYVDSFIQFFEGKGLLDSIEKALVKPVNTQQLPVEIPSVPNNSNPPPKENPPKKTFDPSGILFLLLLLLILQLKVPYKIGGNVEVKPIPERRAIIISPLNALIEDIYVSSGEQVQKGQKLIALKDWGLMEQISSLTGSNGGGYAPRLASEQSQVEQSQLKMKQLEIQQKQAEITHNEKLRKYELYNKLSAKGALPKSLAKEAQAEADLAREEISRLKQEMNLLDEVKRSANYNYQALSGQINFLRNKSGLQIIRSPINGFVLTEDADLKKGVMISPAETLLYLADLNQVEIVIKVFQDDFASLKTGQEVKLVVKAFPEKIMIGRVSKIGLASEDPKQLDPTTASKDAADISRKRWNVRVEIDNPELLLKPGMTGYAYIDSKNKITIWQYIKKELYRIFSLDRFIFLK